MRSRGLLGIFTGFLRTRYEIVVAAYLAAYVLLNLSRTPFWKYLFR